MPDARRIDRPECGWWVIRQTRGGPLIPACIQIVQTLADPHTNEPMERSPFMTAWIGGQPVEIASVWERRGTPIDEADYNFRLAEMTWAVRYAPAEAIAQPRKAVNLRAMSPILPP